MIRIQAIVLHLFSSLQLKIKISSMILTLKSLWDKILNLITRTTWANLRLIQIWIKLTIILIQEFKWSLNQSVLIRIMQDTPTALTQVWANQAISFSINNPSTLINSNLYLNKRKVLKIPKWSLSGFLNSNSNNSIMANKVIEISWLSILRPKCHLAEA